MTMFLVLFVRPSVLVCETYVVHHLVSTGLKVKVIEGQIFKFVITVSVGEREVHQHWGVFIEIGTFLRTWKHRLKFEKKGEI